MRRSSVLRIESLEGIQHLAVLLGVSRSLGISCLCLEMESWFRDHLRAGGGFSKPSLERGFDMEGGLSGQNP